MRWIRRLVYWSRVRAHQDDLREELAFHRDSRATDLRQQGVSPDAADATARAAMGNETYMREEARAVWIPPTIEGVIKDCTAAWRNLRRTPVFTAVVVLMIALCIGMVTATYSVVRHLLVAPLPYPDGNRIVSMELRRGEDPSRGFAMSTSLFQLYAIRSRTLEDFVAVLVNHAPIGDGPGGRTDSVSVGSVTPQFLPLLRMRPMMGRGFAPADAQPGAVPTAMLSEDVWRNRFGGDSGVVGRVVVIAGLRHTIVGVVPRAVGIPDQRADPIDVWLPLDLQAHPRAWVDFALARLRPGVTSAAASRELDAIRKTLPDTGWMNGRRAEALTAPEQVPPNQRRAIVVLFVAAGGLLLIACADVAGLLLMRGWQRRREFAIRLALGAARGRLARQLLTESLLLVVPAAAVGVVAAWLGLRLMTATRPSALALTDAARLDGATLLMTVAVAVGTGLVFSLGPMMLAWNSSLDGISQTETRRQSGLTPAGRRAHATLVITQVALSLMFVVAAGVVTRAFATLLFTPLGYQPTELFEVKVRRAPSAMRPPARPLTPGDRARAIEIVRAALAATPGIQDVALGRLPLSNAGPGPSAVEDGGRVRPTTIQLTGLTNVSPEYFRVAGIPLIHGRSFDGADAVPDREVIINETLARRLWPNRDAVGARFQDWSGEWLTVVGVVGDVHMPGSNAEYYQMQMYRAGVGPGRTVSFLVRVRGANESLRPLLVRGVESAGAGVTIQNVVPASSVLEYAFAAPRFASLLFGVFALLAVGLAAAGLFGNVAFAATRRTHEMAIRVALGAGPRAVGALILGGGLRLATIGCGLGLVGCFVAVRASRVLLYGVRPPGFGLMAGAVLFLIGVAVIASMLPTLRALRVDPVGVLRTD